MKLFTMLGLAAALTSGGDLTSDNPATSKPPANASAAAVAVEELPVLDGVILTRADGSLMQVKVEDSRIVLRFFDKKHKQVAPDVDRATIRVSPASRRADKFFLARSQDGMSLVHGKPVRAPHVFKLDISLFAGTSETAVESFTTNYP